MYQALGDDPIQAVAIRATNDRLALKAARIAAGIPDVFDLATVRANYKADPSDPGAAGPMIAQEILGRAIQPFDTARHSIKRDDYMKAIANMESEISRLRGAPAAPVVTPPTTTVVTPATTPPPPSIATPVLPPLVGSQITVTPAADTPAPVAVAAPADWQAYLPYAIGAGFLFLMLNKKSSKRSHAA